MYRVVTKYKKVFKKLLLFLYELQPHTQKMSAVWLIVHCGNNAAIVTKVQYIVEYNTNTDFMIMIFKNGCLLFHLETWKHVWV